MTLVNCVHGSSFDARLTANRAIAEAIRAAVLAERETNKAIAIRCAAAPTRGDALYIANEIEKGNR